jgi:hypothetical protein
MAGDDLGGAGGGARSDEAHGGRQVSAVSPGCTEVTHRPARSG